MACGTLDGMKSALHVDKAGRVVLPQAVRRQFHLTAGDRLDLEVVSDGIFLRSHSRQAGLVEEKGLLVHNGEPDGDLLGVVELVRSGRDESVSGLRR
jgi:AbrB family looped-hinge helix DNA binding protein